MAEPGVCDPRQLPWWKWADTQPTHTHPITAVASCWPGHMSWLSQRCVIQMAKHTHTHHGCCQSLPVDPVVSWLSQRCVIRGGGGGGYGRNALPPHTLSFIKLLCSARGRLGREVWMVYFTLRTASAESSHKPNMGTLESMHFCTLPKAWTFLKIKVFKLFSWVLNLIKTSFLKICKFVPWVFWWLYSLSNITYV